MKPSQEQIENAKSLLATVKSGVIKPAAGLYNDWVYMATGKKSETAPIDGPNFRSFYHLKQFPCALQLRNKVYHGFFTHEDAAPYYLFKGDDGKDMCFEGIGEFEGVMVYQDYAPKKLFVAAQYPSTKEIIIANTSLTCSCL
jgi:hypothetical protein